MCVTKTLKSYINQFLSSIDPRELPLRRHIKNYYLVDHVRFGQRGNDRISHKRKLKKYINFEAKTLLIIGCGDGSEVLDWAKLGVSKIFAIDFFNHIESWRRFEILAYKIYHTQVIFRQANAENLSFIDDESCDIVVSDAVYEHLNNFDEVLEESVRVLKCGGINYATFGPLWHSFGGDTLGNSQNIKDGYNHIILDADDYRQYREKVLKTSKRCLEYHVHDLFCRYYPSKYLQQMVNNNLKKLYVSAIVAPESIAFEKEFQEFFFSMKRNADHFAPYIHGLTTIHRK